jgi:hypothetical protein
MLWWPINWFVRANELVLLLYFLLHTINSLLIPRWQKCVAS